MYLTSGVLEHKWRASLKGGRTPPTQFLPGWLLSTILLLSLFAGLLYCSTRIKYLPKILHTDSGVNLKEISWPRCKTLKQLFGAVRQVGAPELYTPLAKTIL